MLVNHDFWGKDPIAVIPPERAAEQLNDPESVFLDARFELANPAAGRDRFLAGHLPGAQHVDLERDLSGPVRKGQTGRHPLPAEADLTALFTRLNITGGTKVVVYDDSSGAMAAARLWWLLRYAGHHQVAVLDGGFARWSELGLPVESGEGRSSARTERGGFVADFQRDLAVTTADILNQSYQVLVDSRARERFRGDVEPIDPVGGHIPGAICLPFSENLAPDGTLRDPADLRERFEPLLRSAQARSIVFYCGSGVTAAHNVLAFAHACGQLPAMYPGSWSEWVSDPKRPVATGDD